MKTNYSNTLKAKYLIIAAVFGLLMSSCVTPVNLNYDSARMLKKGDVEVQASGSSYHLDEHHVGTNAGFKLGFGVSEKYNMKIRLEGMSIPGTSESSSGLNFNSGYFELESKFSLAKWAAFSLPVGGYFGVANVVSIDPRFIFTVGWSKYFEFNVIPKCHILFDMDYGTPNVMPAISAGFGISSDLDRWAIRPEIGYDNFLSYGIGFSYYFKKK